MPTIAEIIGPVPTRTTEALAALTTALTAADDERGLDRIARDYRKSRGPRDEGPDWKGRPYAVWHAEELAYERFADLERMMRRAPFPVQHSRKWQWGVGRTKYNAPTDALLWTVPSAALFSTTGKREW